MCALRSCSRPCPSRAAKLVTEPGAVRAWRSVDRLIDAKKARKVEVVDPIVLVGEVVDVCRDYPMPVACRVGQLGVADGVWMLVIDGRIRELQILVRIPFRVCFH